jgi:hypothetical protein
MPTLESIEYERFDYDESPAKSLSLDEAVKEAANLRRGDKQNFYRVRPVDDNMTGFKIEKVSAASVYLDYMNRISKTLSHFMGKSVRAK